MQISWFTVIAQIVNFLVLIWLMKKYLYKPILDAIDSRDKKIAGQIADAKKMKAEAKSSEDEFNKKNQDFDAQKKDLMDKAVAEASDQRNKLLDGAKTEAAALKDKLDKESAQAQQDLNDRLAQKTEQEVFAVTRKTLADLAGLSFEEQAVNVFIKRIDELDETARKPFVEAFKLDKGPILVQSAANLPEKQQAAIEQSINRALGAKPKFEFKTSPELIGGIELTAKGYKLSWNISEYVNDFEKSVAATVKEKPKAIPKKHHAVK
jgi:F-type H+-transporting ATPase subunit b